MGVLDSIFKVIGGGLDASGVVSLLGGGLDYLQEKGANEANLQQVRETNAQNLALTRESWAREDNAVQRRAADLKAAGLNPVLAAGSAASTSGAAQMSAGMSHPALIGDKINRAFDVMRMKQDISQSQAQTDLINKQNDLITSQKQNADWQNKMNRAIDNLDYVDEESGKHYKGADALAYYNLRGGLADTSKKIAEAAHEYVNMQAASWDLNKAKERNISTSAGGLTRQLLEGSDALGTKLDAMGKHIGDAFGRLRDYRAQVIPNRFNRGRNK